MSLLRQLQSKHVLCTAKLIDWAYENGYELTWGETVRTVEQAMHNAKDGSGIANSLHLVKLAVDFALFKDGVDLVELQDFRPLGEYWKTLDPLCCWGGDFISRPDADHFSITWNGIK